MAIQIRAARLPDDADELARVYVASAEHHRTLDPARYRVPPLDAVVGWYRAPRESDERILVADDEEHGIVGVASAALLRRPGPESMVADVPTASLDVAVLPEHRGRGLGRRLIEAVVAAAAETLGAQRLQLDAHQANEGALRLYRDLGFQSMGVLLSRDL